MFHSLEYYTIFAEKLIRTYIKRYNKSFKPPDDMIGYVTHRLIKAEEKYKYLLTTEKNKANKTQEQCRSHFLRMHGIFGIRAYLNNINKKKHRHILSTDINTDMDRDFVSEVYVCDHNVLPEDNVIRNEVLNEKKNFVNLLLNSSGLTEKQKHAVKSHIFDNKTFEKIGAESNPPITAQAVSYAYQTAIAKMRSVIKNKV